jgi:hypothetical protein
MNFNVLDYKNLIIIFHPGLGGNHLMNLISLNHTICQSDPNKLLNQYQSVSKLGNAHFSEIANLRKDHLIKNLDNLKKTSGINLFCGHLGEHIWVNDILSKLEKRLYLIIAPSEDLSTKGHQRISKFNPALKDGRYFYHEMCTLYNIENISKLYGIPQHDISVIDADILFSPKLDQLFEFLSEEFLLIFSDSEKNNCNKIHKLWWESLCEKF